MSQVTIVRKGYYFEIKGSFPIITGEALTDSKNGSFKAQIFSDLFPLGKTLTVNVTAPDREISKREFDKAKAELKAKAERGQAGWPEQQ
ncbi:MAG: hypothetical protein HYR70_04165 [Chloroflexi bacterium]|nr:hypothetical protein [Chloroflexota bacterium]MBI3340751.1 hypothetical protein [Chloroflexota bacterium]